MTWTELLGSEVRRLRAQEETSVAVLSEMRVAARGTVVKHILQEMVDDAPGRMGRLDMVLGALGAFGPGVSLLSFEGWLGDVRALDAPPLGEAHDAALLGLLLRFVRVRTSCYEVAYVLAKSLRAEGVTNLIGVLLAADQETDAHVAESLARVVLDGEGRWEIERLPP